MLVRKIRSRHAPTLSDRVQTTIRPRLQGSPVVEARLTVASGQQIDAFVAAWNGARKRCASLGWGEALAGVKIALRDEGPPAKLKAGTLTVNVLKLEKNPVAQEVLVHELGRQVWSQKLSTDQRRAWGVIWDAIKGKGSPEEGFAVLFQKLATGKPTGERWSAVRL